MSDAARAKAHLVVTLLERADYPDIAAGVIAEALDAFAAEQTAQVRQEVESVLLADEQTIERLTAQVARLRLVIADWLGFHNDKDHSVAECRDWKFADCRIAERSRALLADPAVQASPSIWDQAAEDESRVQAESAGSPHRPSERGAAMSDAARAVDTVGEPMCRASDLSAALAQVARLREELMGHAHACAACRVLLADPTVQGIEASSREKA